MMADRTLLVTAPAERVSAIQETSWKSAVRYHSIYESVSMESFTSGYHTFSASTAIKKKTETEKETENMKEVLSPSLSPVFYTFTCSYLFSNTLVSNYFPVSEKLYISGLPIKFSSCA